MKRDDDDRTPKPVGTRRTLVVKGRQDNCVTVVVEVYRGKVWVISIDPPFSSEAIFEPIQVDCLIDLLAQAANKARGGTKGRETSARPRISGED